jgi:hypothetical protein
LHYLRYMPYISSLTPHTISAWCIENDEINDNHH